MFDLLNRILVVSPHADDEAFGCGGLLQKMKCAGSKIFLLLVACSDLTYRDGTIIEGKKREGEFKAVADELGAEWRNLWLPDRNLQTVQEKVVAGIEEGIDEFKPDVLLFPSPSFHQDHRTVFHAAHAACRPRRADSVHTCACYEVPNYVWHEEAEFFVPNIFLKLSEEQLKDKLTLCRLYGTQVGKDNAPISLTLLREHSMYRGHQSGVSKYAEAYRLVRTLT